MVCIKIRIYVRPKAKAQLQIGMLWEPQDLGESCGLVTTTTTVAGSTIEIVQRPYLNEPLKQELESGEVLFKIIFIVQIITNR